MRVIIVDDDKLIREEIKSLCNWKKEGFELVYEAANGKEALFWLQANQADIIITDISMPVMNGVELIKNLKADQFAGQIVVMSNYDEFDYVKDAMKYGAFDYCLKYKMDSEGLLEILNAMAQKIRESSQKNEVDLFEKREKEYLNYFKLIRNACMGFSSSEESIQHTLSQHASKFYFIFYVSHGELGAENKQIEEMLKAKGMLWIFLSTKEHACIMSLSSNSIYQKTIHLFEYATLLKKTIEEPIITYSINEIAFEGLCTQISILKKKSGIYFYEGQSIIVADSVAPFTNQLDLAFAKLLDDGIMHSLANSDQKAFANSLTEYADRVSAKRVVPGMVIRHMCALTYQMIHYLQSYGIGEESVALLSEACIEFSDYDATMTGICKKLVAATEPLFNFVGIKNSKGMRLEILKAIQYMNSHYMKNILLNDVASYVGLSRNHFCTVFREETGEKYVSYLLKIRMEKSKEYLRDYKNRIQEVSYMVGIDNPRYFCKLFKEYTGVSPSEFRERNYEH